MEPDKSLRTFEGAVAIVTGGASGFGRALGEALARQGAWVVLADLQVDVCPPEQLPFERLSRL